VNTVGNADYDKFQNERYQEAFEDVELKETSYRSLVQVPREYDSLDEFKLKYFRSLNDTNTTNSTDFNGSISVDFNGTSSNETNSTECIELSWNILEQDGSNLVITHPGCVTMSQNFNIGPANSLYVVGTTKLYCKDTLLLGSGNFGFFVSGNAEVHNCHVKDKVTGFFLTGNAKVFDSSARFSDFGFRMGSSSYGSGLIAAKNEVGIQMQGSASSGMPVVENSLARENTEAGFFLADNAKLVNSQAYKNDRGIHLSGESDSGEYLLVSGVASVQNKFGVYLSGASVIDFESSGFCANTMDYLEQTDLIPFSGEVSGDFQANTYEFSPFASSQPSITDC
jgi:hypothetical protein